MHAQEAGIDGLFKSYITVVNRALAAHKDEAPYKQLLQVGERLTEGKTLGVEIYKTEPQELSKAVSSTTASEVTKLMVATVADGTASPAQIPGIDVAGKTGTAQSGIDAVPPYAWFISFAPADDPKVAVAVMIQKADIPRGEIAGGVYGGPIAKAVMEAVIK